MRSRPKMQVVVSPMPMRAGQPLEVVAELTSRTETPVRAVRFKLRGLEWRNARDRRRGATVLAEQLIFLDERATERTVLTPGVHRFSATFDVPGWLPPSYSSRTARVAYLLDVRVDIPWWPDRRETYELKLVPRPLQAVAGPKLYATNVGGPRGSEPYLEASVDDALLEAGAPLTGAVSFANLSHKRVRHVDLRLLAVESGVGATSVPPLEARRYVSRLLNEPPVDGARYPFQLVLPPDAPPTFSGNAVRVDWFLEIGAAIAFGVDPVLRLPLQVSAPGAQASRGRAPPAVGSERRAALWAKVAQDLGLAFDAESERLSATAGAVQLEVRCESGGGGAELVASLQWPRLGLELDGRPRRWLDHFGREPLRLDPALDKVLAVQGCAPERVRAFFTPELSRALAQAGSVDLDDAGALLSAPGAGYTLEEIDRFARLALEAARAADRALAQLPPPAGLADRRAQWESFARELGGELAPASFWIEHAQLESAALELGPELRADGAARGLRVRLLLETGVDRRIDLRAEPQAAPARLASTLASLLEGDEAFSLSPGVLEAELPLPDDLRAILPLLRAMSRVARASEAA